MDGSDRTPESLDVAPLLAAARVGEKDAVDHLFQLAYEELRRLARQVRRGRGADTLNTTGLVHEAYLKLARSNSVPANDAAHFKRLIARAMRQVLVDAARRRSAKRRAETRLEITLTDAEGYATALLGGELLDLDRALQELSRVDDRRSAVIECRFFGGMDVEETALALGISTATVKRDWRVARAWLLQAVG